MATRIVVANSMAAVRHGRYRPIAAFPAKRRDMRPNHLAARDVTRQLNAPDNNATVWSGPRYICVELDLYSSTRGRRVNIVFWGRLLWE